MELQKDTDFTLADHYDERIKFHWKMLKYYLDEQSQSLRPGCS